MIIHICERLHGDEAQKMGEYRPESLTVEGFIHASQPGQGPGGRQPLLPQ